jgi:Periplasmic binding protein
MATNPDLHTQRKKLLPIMRLYFILLIISGLLVGCDAPKRAVPSPNRPKPTQPTRPATTTPNPNPTQPSGTPVPNAPTNPTTGNVTRPTYRIALLMPFQTNMANSTSPVPEKSELSLQFYAGFQLALNDASLQPNTPNLVVDVLDAQSTDADFAVVMNDNRLAKAQVVIGPTKGTQVSTLAAQTKNNRQVHISPKSPNSELTTLHPGFVQLNPSLRTHCVTILQHLRSTLKYTPAQIVLVAKEKERDRLSYFQDANTAMGGAALNEAIVPDAATNFDKIDLKRYIKAGQTTAFVMPSWAGQDWVVAFLARLKAIKGNNTVEVYGMPQWLEYEQIEPELLSSLNVHVTAATYIDRNDAATVAFEQRFYEQFGTIPDNDAFSGYDTGRWLSLMLSRHGLAFPEKSSEKSMFETSMCGGFYLRRAGAVDAATFDYVENVFAHLLRFNGTAYIPVD